MSENPPGTGDEVPSQDAAEPSGPRSRPARRTVLAAGIPAAAAVAGITALTAPRPARLGEPAGDPELADAVRPHLDGHRRVAVALLDGAEGTRFAGFGADQGTEFEIGSVSKTFTGALLAEAVDRGEATLGTTVGEVLGAQADGSAIADVTLTELTTHTSGLPRLAPGTMVSGLISSLWRKDPYRHQEADEVVATALETGTSDRGEPAYSNLGAALQGQLLASLAGTDFATLLTERILDPLGLADTYAPITPAGLRPGAPVGRTSTGLSNAAWTMAGHAPAGGIRSTAADLATYLGALADGSAPGAAATDTVLVEAEDGERRAMNWFLEDSGDGGPPITWHNGMTGGFAGFAGFVPADGRAVAVLSDTARSVDDLARALLSGEVAP